jgi:peptidoglycan/LPS O-acetylase OafA/YrhL
LIYPIIFKYLRNKIIYILIFFIISINISKYFLQYSFFYFFESIIIGALFSFFNDKFTKIKIIYKYSYILFFLSLLLLIILLNINFIHSNLLISINFCLILFLLFQNNNKIIYYIFNNPILEFVCILSYSLYIWQELFLVNNGLINKNNINNISIILLFLFLISFLSYNFIEKPFLKYSIKYKYLKNG